MILNINISSKDLYSLNFFLNFFLKMLNAKSLTLNSFFDVKTVSNKKKVFTVLTSPHVNKTAQEQFKTEFFVSKIMITSNQIPKLLIFLKQINKNLFVNVDLKFKIYLNNKISINNKRNQLNPNNYRFNLYSKHSNYVSKNYLDILSTYGEVSFKKNILI